MTMAGVGQAAVRGAAGAGAGVTAARAAQGVKGKGSSTITAVFLLAGLLFLGAAWTGKSPAALVREVVAGAKPKAGS
jgi:hypothetical protein